MSLATAALKIDIKLRLCTSVKTTNDLDADVIRAQKYFENYVLVVTVVKRYIYTYLITSPFIFVI